MNRERFFEVDSGKHCHRNGGCLAQLGKAERGIVAKAIGNLGVDPEKSNRIRY